MTDWLGEFMLKNGEAIADVRFADPCACCGGEQANVFSAVQGFGWPLARIAGWCSCGRGLAGPRALFGGKDWALCWFGGPLA